MTTLTLPLCNVSATLRDNANLDVKASIVTVTLYNADTNAALNADSDANANLTTNPKNLALTLTTIVLRLALGLAMALSDTVIVLASSLASALNFWG